MDRETFLELLLGVMERKDHWAWPAFTSGLAPKERLHIHFEQEYATYVRDFPVMVGWADAAQLLEGGSVITIISASKPSSRK